MTETIPPSTAAALEARLGYRFDDPTRLARALVHRSAGEAEGGDNERLEFLGDRVLGLIVAELLFEAFPDEPEGGLSKRSAALVRRETLAEVAADWDLAAHIVVAVGNEASLAVRADAVEAVIGAVFVDGGFAAAQALVRRFWAPRLAQVRAAPRDAKTALQEWSQARGLGLPVYREIGRSGPPHAPSFVVEVEVAGTAPIRAEGRSKRAAEQRAASSFLASAQARGA